MMLEKSSRHQKIIGDFGEHLICNFLSRSGFEVSIMDHTGLDIIAYNPRTRERLGITVKSRTRNIGKEETTVNFLSNREKENDRQKLLDACEAFNCIPWIGIYVETQNSSDLYLTSLSHYDETYRVNKCKVIDNWNMKKSDKEKYQNDPEVKHLEIVYKETNWWKP